MNRQRHQSQGNGALLAAGQHTTAPIYLGSPPIPSLSLDPRHALGRAPASHRRTRTRSSIGLFSTPSPTIASTSTSPPSSLSPDFTPSTVFNPQLAALPDPPEGQRPTATVIELIKAALLGSPNGKASLREIYNAIATRFTYFQESEKFEHLRNSVRQRLSNTACFRCLAEERPESQGGRGGYWQYVEEDDRPSRRRKSSANLTRRPPNSNVNTQPDPQFGLFNHSDLAVEHVLAQRPYTSSSAPPASFMSSSPPTLDRQQQPSAMQLVPQFLPSYLPQHQYAPSPASPIVERFQPVGPMSPFFPPPVWNSQPPFVPPSPAPALGIVYGPQPQAADSDDSWTMFLNLEAATQSPSLSHSHQ